MRCRTTSCAELSRNAPPTRGDDNFFSESVTGITVGFPIISHASFAKRNEPPGGSRRLVATESGWRSAGLGKARVLRDTRVAQHSRGDGWLHESEIADPFVGEAHSQNPASCAVRDHVILVKPRVSAAEIGWAELYDDLNLERADLHVRSGFVHRDTTGFGQQRGGAIGIVVFGGGGDEWEQDGEESNNCFHGCGMTAIVILGPRRAGG